LERREFKTAVALQSRRRAKTRDNREWKKKEKGKRNKKATYFSTRLPARRMRMMVGWRRADGGATCKK
jgi:hypothetical protein